MLYISKSFLFYCAAISNVNCYWARVILKRLNEIWKVLKLIKVFCVCQWFTACEWRIKTQTTQYIEQLQSGVTWIIVALKRDMQISDFFKILFGSDGGRKLKSFHTSSFFCMLLVLLFLLSEHWMWQLSFYMLFNGHLWCLFAVNWLLRPVSLILWKDGMKM